MCYAIKYFVKGFCDLRRPPRIVLTFQKQYVSLRFLDQYFSALATNISAKTILGGGILQFPAGPKSSEPIFVGFSTASHQRGQNVAAWQEMEVQVAANTNTNTDTNTLTNSNTNKSTIFAVFCSTASHQLGQNVAAWQEMEFEVATDDGEEVN